MLLGASFYNGPLCSKQKICCSEEEEREREGGKKTERDRGWLRGRVLGLMGLSDGCGVVGDE